MNEADVAFAVFTKPWKTQSIQDVAKFISGLGFDGIEFPLREGYQVDLDTVETSLPKAVKVLAEYGLKVYSVASHVDERVFAACQASGIPIIRTMASFPTGIGYLESEASFQKKLAALIPLCEKYAIKVGVQNHFGFGVSTAMELLHLVEEFDPRHVGAIWDAGHSGLAGEEPERGLSIVWSHLLMVNLKTAFYQRVNGPEAEYARWKRYFTSGTHGLASWPQVAAYLKQRRYQGVVCLTAEYTDEEHVNRLIAKDIEYAKSLF